MEQRIKTIGLIGGVSWESSKIYYEYINQMVRQQLGSSHSAKSIMTSVDFAEIVALTLDHNWDGIGEIIAAEAARLQKAGADHIVLCSNLIHVATPHIQKAIGIPFLHIAKATGEAIKAKNLKKVALLGTRYTMEMDFYTNILEKDYGLEVITPGPDDRTRLNTIIYDELVKGIFTDHAKHICLEIIEKMKTEGAEGIILGCTELPLIVADTDVDIPTFNTTRIHAQLAVDVALSDVSLAKHGNTTF